jgi:N-acetylated-alpha-linked acidic dipeptidase
MRKSFLPAACLIFSFTFSFAQNKDYSGFSAASAKLQQQWEVRFDSFLHPTDIDHWLKILSAVPHHVGSPGDAANVQYLLQLYKQWGFDAHIDTFYCLFPTPKFRLLEEISPTPFKASLQEQPLKEDATSSQTSMQLPTYNAYSADGDVTGDLVYVNQGVPADYDQLAQMGVDVKGKIVIARYGGSWRGIKPRLAQEHGAIGCIIYSDPKDDGYYQGDTYPDGPFRNSTGVQRGSVADMPMFPGDPLTPGIGATKDAKRLDRADAPTLLKIPVLPISYSDAQPLLAALKGPVAPENWRGALPITYHVGPGPAKVHLKLEFNWDIKQVYDVIAMMKGSEAPDEWVIRGNHQDAWVNGAADPLSGQVSMLAEAQAVGELVKEGMRPKRTIVYCSWDGEEPGLLGSTEWAETNASELQRKAVAYINSDGNGRGFFYAAGSHTLQTLVNESAGDVKDPEYGISVLQRRLDKDAVDASDPTAQAKILSSSTMKIDALGSGSDYTSFLQHLGIASLNLFYGNEDNGGDYHSIFDSYDMFRRFKDPGFFYEVALAKTAGRITMRLANADVLPFNFNDFYSTVNDYANDLMKKTDDLRTSTSLTNQMLNNKDFVYASDPTKTYVPPAPKDAVPYIDFSPLQNALSALKISADNYQTAFTKSATQLSDSAKAKLNILLYQSERKLLTESGLPNRSWFKHAIYAPGYYTGYGVKTLPGIREAIENRDWTLAQQQIGVDAKAILAFSQQVDAASAELK